MPARRHVIQKASALAMGRSKLTASFTMMEVLCGDQVVTMKTMTLLSLATMELQDRIVIERVQDRLIYP